MKISIIQPDIIWEDKPRNFDKLEYLISSSGSNPDIIILPEMFSTGFTMNPENLSESPGSETFDWMVNISEKGNCGLCGSYIVREKNSTFNRWIFVTPEKKSWYYNKRHLFKMGNEQQFYTAGSRQLIFKFRGVRIMAAVCYDLRFPVWSRNRNNYDLLINSANWPESRRDVWITLLKARAIENQCYVAAANRIGTDGEHIKYCGDSMIINPRGKIVADAKINKESVISGDISMTELSEFRKKFPVLKDADSFTIQT
jgi:predicted amidohydrolase